MNNLISLSSGFCYKVIADRNQMITETQKFKIDGVEIQIPHADELLDFELSSQNLEYLKSLEFITIHAPIEGIRYSNSPKCYSVMDKLNSLYDLVGAQNITFHPLQVDDWDIFKQYDFISSIENEDNLKPAFNTAEEMKTIFDNNHNLSFTFDFAHALTLSHSSIDEFLNIGKIVEVHVSYHYPHTPGHLFLHQHSNKHIINELHKLPAVPLIMECSSENHQDMSKLNKEIEFIRSV